MHEIAHPNVWIIDFIRNINIRRIYKDPSNIHTHTDYYLNDDDDEGNCDASVFYYYESPVFSKHCLLCQMELRLDIGVCNHKTTESH